MSAKFKERGMNRPYKAYKKTEEETKLNKEIGKKIKEARLNHVVMYEVEQDMNGNSFMVKQFRKKLVTQSELSKQIGVTFQQIQKYEKGQNGISSTKLLKISRFFKKPLAYFVSGANELLGQDVPPNNNPTAPSLN